MTGSATAEPYALGPLERRIGFRFKDRDLLIQAFCHTSYVNERPEEVPGSNERLEFLGDAILGAVIADWLYRALPECSEGDLTVIRSALVREETLAKWAADLGLGEFLKLGRGESLSGGRARPPLLARAFEALVGAVFLEKGDRAVRKLLQPFFDREMEMRVSAVPLVDAKSRLQQISQMRFGTIPQYRILDTTGPEHEPTFTSEVTLEPELSFRGSGRAKRLAEQAAATAAIAALAAHEGDAES